MARPRPTLVRFPGELAALVGVEDLRAAMPQQRLKAERGQWPLWASRTKQNRRPDIYWGDDKEKMKTVPDVRHILIPHCQLVRIPIGTS